MSNHRSQKAIDLHHNQVNEGKSRRVQRQVGRTMRYLAKGEEARMEYNCVLVFDFLGFAYIMFVTAVYLRFLI